MDRKLFKETFSALRAPEEAISEVINMTQNQSTQKHARLPRALGALAACLALMLGLAVTANAATGGELFDTIACRILPMTRINDFKCSLVGNDGEEFTVLGVKVDLINRDGRAILVVGEDEVDITDELNRDGSYTYERTDGGTVCHAEVAGTPEDWTLRYAFYDEGANPDFTMVRTPGHGWMVLEDEDGEVILAGDVTDIPVSDPEDSFNIGTTFIVTGPED